MARNRSPPDRSPDAPVGGRTAEEEAGQLGADRVGLGAGCARRDVGVDAEVVVEHVEALGEQRDRHLRLVDRARCSSVVLPDPLGPTRAIRSGPETARSSLRRRTTRPRGTSVPGRSIRISRSSRSRDSASSSRSRAWSRRSSWTLRYFAADFSAWLRLH